MKEKYVFEVSGHIKDRNDLQEIEFWGHDAGEFVLEELLNSLETDGSQTVPEASPKSET